MHVLDWCQSACGFGDHASGAAVMQQQEYFSVCEDKIHAATMQRPQTKDYLPTSMMLVLSRTQVHALGGFDVLDLPLVLGLARRLGLRRARDVRIFPKTDKTTAFFPLELTF